MDRKLIIKSKQRGYGMALLFVLLALLSVSGTIYYESRTSQAEASRVNYDQASDEAQMLVSALMQYYADSRTWPSSLNDLVVGGYFTGDSSRCGGGGALQSPVCTTIFGNPVGEDYQLTVNLLDEKLAQAVANQIIGGSSSGTTLVATIPKPNSATLYEDYLQRAGDASNPEATKLETSIDINDNDITNVDSLDIESVNIETYQGEASTIRSLNVTTVKLGQNTLTSQDDVLEISAGTVETTGNVSVADDVILNGGNVTDINTISANNGELISITADSGNINAVSGNTIDYTTGVVDTLDGNSLAYGTGQFTTTVGEAVNYTDGTIDALSGNNATYSEGLIASLQGNMLTTSSATVSTGNISYVDTSNANLGSLNVLNSASLNSLSGNTASLTTINAGSASIDQGNVGEASGNTVTTTGRSTLTNLDSNDLNADSINASEVDAEDGYVSNDVGTKNLDIDRLVVKGTLTTDTLVANSASLGNTTTDTLSINGTLTANGINATTVSFNTASISQASGTSANLTSLSSNRFDGGSFNSDDDFTTSKSSVNENYIALNDQKDKLDHCMDVSKYCIPEDPTVSLTCTNCTANSPRSNFSGTASGAIKGCRQGCTYSWVKSGSNLTFASCPAGAVTAGGTANVSCSFSANLNAQQSASGTLELVVKNSHYTNRISSESVNVSYTNTDTGQPLSERLSHSCSGSCVDCSTPASDCTATWYSPSEGAVLDVGLYLNIEGCNNCTYSWNLMGTPAGVATELQGQRDESINYSVSYRCPPDMDDGNFWGMWNVTVSDPTTGESATLNGNFKLTAQCGVADIGGT